MRASYEAVSSTDYRVGYGPGLAELMFRMFARFSNPLTIEYLPVYTPNKEEIADPALFATNVRQVMAKVHHTVRLLACHSDNKRLWDACIS